MSQLFAEPVGRGFTWRGLALAVTAVAGGTGLSLFRQGGVGPFNTVWAEDGAVFLRSTADHSVLDTFTMSYAGYFHTIPRLIAGLATTVPLRDAAPVISVSAAFATALMALLVYLASAGHLSSQISRLLVAAVTIVVPIGMHDGVPNSIANLQWPLLYTLFWLLIWTPRGWPGRIVAVITTLAIAVTTILTPALFPLALVRVLRRGHDGRRDGFGGALFAALLVGFGLQLLGLIAGDSSRDTSPAPKQVVLGYLLRVVPPGLFGENAIPEHVGGRWLALAALAWLLIAAAILIALARWTRPAWALAAAAGISSVGVYALPVLISGLAAGRYATPATMMLTVMLIALLEPRTTTTRTTTTRTATTRAPASEEPIEERTEAPASKVRRAGAARLRGRAAIRGRGPHLALTVLLVTVWLVNLRNDNPRNDGPGWRQQVDHATEVCAAGGPEATVDIAPRFQPVSPTHTGWYIAWPCSTYPGR